MGFDSIWHWVALLVIVLVIFGTGKLTKIGPDLGNAVRGFKKALHGDEDGKSKADAGGEKLEADPAPAADSTNAKQEQHDSTESK